MDLKAQRRANMRLLILHTALQLCALFILPLLLLPVSAAWGWLLLPIVALTNPWWSFMHEAIHGVMFADKALNRLAGRSHAILYGAPFDLLRWGHLLHHAYSRTPRERSEVYVAGRDSRWRVMLAYYFRLCGGLYLYEVIGGLLSLLPTSAIRRLSAHFAGPENLVGELVERVLAAAVRRDFRIDAIAIVALYALAFAAYGQAGWMLLLYLYGRGLLISLVDNAFHYGTPLDDVRFARNLSLPGPLSRLLLHFNLHGAHHARARVPWSDLPESHRQSGQGYQDEWFTAIFRQFRGPIAEQRLPRYRTAAGEAVD